MALKYYFYDTGDALTAFKKNMIDPTGALDKLES